MSATAHQMRRRLKEQAEKKGEPVAEQQAQTEMQKEPVKAEKPKAEKPTK